MNGFIERVTNQNTARKWTPWTSEEKQYLQDNWGVVSIKLMATHLNRSVNAVIVMKEKLGLGAFLNNGEYIVYHQLLQALGIAGGMSYKNISWINNKGFPVKFKAVNQCKFKVVYFNDFWKWAEANQTMIDWSKVEKNILGKEPVWVEKQRKADYLKNLKVKTTPWTKAEDEKLKYLLKQFVYSYSELSKQVHRTEGAIQRRINDLGLKERPLKADNHTKWTDDEYLKLGEMIKQRISYELMSDELGKSSKAIRGRVYDMYLSENIDKVAAMIGNGMWGDGRPERKISSRLLNAVEREQVKDNLTKLAGIFKGIICKHYDDSDYWQKDLCMNWDDGCTAGEINCDSCTSFVRIRPQYCRRCGVTIITRKKTDMCDKCKVARKRQHHRKWMALYGGKKKDHKDFPERVEMTV